jgi:redox-sensitive bicupin YhaK (pirin superfamily)
MKEIRKVVKNIPQHWVGDGFPVRSLFSYHDSDAYDPFLLLDYAGPYEFAPSEAVRGVGEHPHRGFETVTVVYQGELEHRDSSGSHGKISAGDVQWMTAASGIVHEEYHSEQFAREGGALEMVQLWLNLPASEKMSSPRYQEILDTSIPRAVLPNDSGYVRVIAGEFQDIVGAARTVTPVNLWDLRLAANSIVDIRIPEGHNSLLIVQKGQLQVNDTTVNAVELVSFEPAGEQVRLRTSDESQVLVLTGQPIREPVVGQGPFVMNTREEIYQAVHDYQQGLMGRLA